MDTSGSRPHLQAGRIRRLYDKLAALLAARGPDRADAFADELERQERADDDRSTQGGDNR